MIPVAFYVPLLEEPLVRNLGQEKDIHLPNFAADFVLQALRRLLPTLPFIVSAQPKDHGAHGGSLVVGKDRYLKAGRKLQRGKN
jgi:hypothetical protein